MDTISTQKRVSLSCKLSPFAESGGCKCIFFSDCQINRVEETTTTKKCGITSGRGGDEGYVEEAWTHSVEHAFPTGWLRQHFNLTPKHSTTRCDASTTTSIPPTLPGARPPQYAPPKKKWKGEKKNPCFIYRSFFVKKKFPAVIPHCIGLTKKKIHRQTTG